MYWSNPYQRKARKKEGKGKKKHHYAHGPSGLGWPDSVFLGPIKMFETKKHILCLLAPEFKKKTTKLNRCSIKMSAKLNTMSTSLMAKFSIHKNSITLDTSLKGRSFSPWLQNSKRKPWNWIGVRLKCLQNLILCQLHWWLNLVFIKIPLHWTPVWRVGLSLHRNS